MKREDKARSVADLKERMGQAKVAILTRYTGINVEKMTQLRRELRKEKVTYQVVKNTLFKLAVKGTDKEGLSPHMEGPVGIASSDSDPVAPARVLSKFAKDFPELKIMLAASDGKLWGPEQIQAWVALPSLTELRGRILGLIQAPASTLARLAGTPGSQIARVLKARSEQAQS
ncbi:MAG TPA: 50S ribosomal protein L10 [Thermodesulfobacteriota bacterium]|nr:50S ribosomal protein L10 [Thermodesulfobacteriota bacterium]